MSRPRFAGLALFVVSALAALAIVEVGARLILDPPRTHRRLLELAPQLGFRGVPSAAETWTPAESDRASHVVELNRDGFRGRPLPSSAAPAGVRRIAFFGDSFLVGEAVPAEQLLTSRVAARLADRGERAEVYNLSAIDYGTGQELLLFDRVAPELRPDVVVVALYPSNDLINDAIELSGRTRVSPGDPIRPYVMPQGDGELESRWATPIRSMLRRASRAFAVLEFRLSPPTFGRVDSPGIYERLRNGRTPREFLELYRRHDPGHRWEIAWQRTQALLRAFRDRTEALGASFHVLVIPNVLEVTQTAVKTRLDAEARSVGTTLSSLLDWNLPERRLAAFFEDQGIAATLLRDDFRRLTAGGSALYARDGHLSREGHEAVAEAMTQAVLGPSGSTDLSPVALPRKPVDWPASADASWHDVRLSPRARFFGNGWSGWRAARGDVAGGWLVQSEGLLVLQSAEGRLLLRGRVSRPVELEVGIIGGTPARFPLSEAGRFEAALPPPASRLVGATGYVAVGIGVLRAESETAVRPEVLIQEVGFESAIPGG